MFKIAVGVILSLLAACTTHEDAMKSWVGYPVSNLMKQWGPPDKQAKLDDGSTIMEWGAPRTTVLPVIQGTTGVANIQALGTTNYSSLSTQGATDYSPFPPATLSASSRSTGGCHTRARAAGHITGTRGNCATWGYSAWHQGDVVTTGLMCPGEWATGTHSQGDICEPRRAAVSPHAPGLEGGDWNKEGQGGGRIEGRKVRANDSDTARAVVLGSPDLEGLVKGSRGSRACVKTRHS
jgi:hypothetical protein